MKAELIDSMGNDLTRDQQTKIDQDRFVIELEDCGDWAAASKAIGRSRNTTNGWRKNNKVFADRVYEALRIWRGDDGVKRCRKCREIHPTTEFAFRTDRQSYRASCASCRRVNQKKRYNHYRTHSWFKLKCTRARSRAQNIKLPFNLTEEYLEGIWTGFCPVTGVELLKDVERTHPQLAELDRMVPEKGYVKGNVTFMSTRMNRLKNDATLEELQALCAWIKQTQGEQDVS